MERRNQHRLGICVFRGSTAGSFSTVLGHIGQGRVGVVEIFLGSLVIYC